MNTEITEYNKECVFYDAECSVCRKWADRLRDPLKAPGLRVVPFQSDFAKQALRLADNEVPDEMKVFTPRGETLGGADGLIYLARYFWWGRGLRVIAQVPGVRAILRRAYAAFARRRYCVKGGCRL